MKIEDQFHLETKMANANSYGVWSVTAENLDRIKELDKNWSLDDESLVYDYNLIRHRREMLNKARLSKDISQMIYLLRSGLLRNLGGLNEIYLYSHLFLKTKKLIEDYHEEVVKNIQEISKCPPSSGKHEFLTDTRQSFGCSALILHGGASFALYHFGVAKTLFEQSLLPRIISGSSISALAAALICIHTDDELARIFDASGIKLDAFQKREGKGGYKRKLIRLIQHGYLLDSNVLTQGVNDNLGDITFEEAFKKTRRILNITVSSERKNEVPRLLNYLTAPTVLIRTAACASASSLGIFRSVDLLAKDKTGKVVPWTASHIKWGDSSYDSESPETRLAELFNVNHFIVSQSSPLATPFLPKGPQYRKTSFFESILAFMFNEFRHRINQIGYFGFLPATVKSLFSHKILGHVTISPTLTLSDFTAIFSNPNKETMKHWILKGEKSTWPYITLIRNRTMVEFALDKAKHECELEMASRAPMGSTGSISAASTDSGLNKTTGGVWGGRRRSSFNSIV
ncbi:acyl transferase/acyl hydrolase/lysophospholipase [Obelidium mucronatum]|nr:acyl transferase/acyl hydrolase/lysophospholipase [Obelidium mucronatum]